jgi:dTDP-4-amino-4,6-dideoxygalactose transaminase
MTVTQVVPFLDLVAPHADAREELLQVFNAVLDSGSFIGGPMVQEFEQNFGHFCDTQHCVGVGSGTDALRFALLALGIGPDDIVVTVPNTFIATTEAISQTGARPDFVDIDERTYNMDPQKLREYLDGARFTGGKNGRLIHQASGRRIAAVVPVHLYGQTADMDPILELAERYNLAVIEDACQAHGAKYFSKRAGRWQKAGSMGQAAAFSFYPGKNLGACGEAGAATTNDEGLAQRIRMLRDHGQSRKYHHEIEGYNGRLDAIQAGILQAKLKRLPEWTEKRRAAAERYRELIAASGAEITLPYEPSWSSAVYHLFVVRARNRDGLIKILGSAGIGTGIHYPVPLHLQRAYQSLGYKTGDFPVAEEVAAEILSLPLFPHLLADQQDRVVREVSTFARPELVMAASVS